MPFRIAERLLNLTTKYDIPLLFKASYKKANRSRKDSFIGIGDMKALKLLKKVGEQFHVPVVTDIHSVEEAYMAADFVDVIQIPAFLCRQTELLVAAAKTGKVLNIKKGQFLSGRAMHHAAEKVLQAGNNKIILTERGNTFGYQDLVVDFRNIPEMQESGYPVVVDITHSLQQPNQASGITGGKPQLIGLMGNAAIASGADGLFLETHPNPQDALSDGANMLQIDLLEELLVRWIRIREAVT
jgi:2-dehydro-3-deoxyphosphooctonate aldolase (KDO 8-P synthase)